MPGLYWAAVLVKVQPLFSSGWMRLRIPWFSSVHRLYFAKFADWFHCLNLVCTAVQVGDDGEKIPQYFKKFLIWSYSCGSGWKQCVTSHWWPVHGRAEICINNAETETGWRRSGGMPAAAAAATPLNPAFVKWKIIEATQKHLVCGSVKLTAYSLLLLLIYYKTSVQREKKLPHIFIVLSM